MTRDKALAKWMPTGVALVAMPFALVFGLFFAALRFLFYLGWLRYLVDRADAYVIIPI